MSDGALYLRATKPENWGLMRKIENKIKKIMGQFSSRANSYYGVPLLLLFIAPVTASQTAVPTYTCSLVPAGD